MIVCQGHGALNDDYWDNAMSDYREAARQILEPIIAQYRSPHDIVRVDESAFPHLGFESYARVGKILKSRGFSHLADYELLDISNDPRSLYQRTLIRSFVSADGHVVGSCYQLKPRMGRVLRDLATGIRNLRWLDAPRFFLEMLPTRMIIDLETELSDGRFIGSSNAEAAGQMSSPPTVQQMFYPYDTGIEVLLNAQAYQLEAAIRADPSLRVLRVCSWADELRMGERLKLQRNAHRAAVNWISESELIAMSGGNPELAHEIFEEVQALLREGGYATSE